MQTAKTPSLVEHTATYKVVINEILNDNAITMQLVNNNMQERVASGELDQLDLDTVSKILQRLTDSHTKLTPKITMKQEEVDKDGVKRTIWSEKQGNSQA